MLLHGRTAEEARAADFARLDEVEAMAARVVAEHPHLDVLVNSFLAHYLLTCLLEPALTSEPGGRVVNVSSSLHRTGSIQSADLLVGRTA